MRRQKMNLSPTDFPFILVWWCFGLLFYSGGLLCIHAGGFPPYGLALPQGVMVFGQKECIGFFSSQHFVVLNLGASRRDPLVPRESFENPHSIAHLFNVCRKVYFFSVWYVAFFSDFPIFWFSAISALLIFWLTDGAADWVWKKTRQNSNAIFPHSSIFLKRFFNSLTFEDQAGPWRRLGRFRCDRRCRTKVWTI